MWCIAGTSVSAALAVKYTTAGLLYCAVLKICVEVISTSAMHSWMLIIEQCTCKLPLSSQRRHSHCAQPGDTVTLVLCPSVLCTNAQHIQRACI